jgi:hypothetical protein
VTSRIIIFSNLGKRIEYVGFEVLTAVVERSYISWDIAAHSALKVNDVSDELVVSIFRVEE